MIRLSRAGWNNVIIYSVMAFILLINLTQQNKQEEAPEIATHTLLSEHQVILTLTVNQMVSVERIGQTWRVLPHVAEQQLLEQMMSSWHQLEVQPIEAQKDFDKSRAVIVSVLFAGESELHYFLLAKENQQLIIFKQTPLGEKLWFSAPSQLFEQLLPYQILHHENP